MYLEDLGFVGVDWFHLAEDGAMAGYSEHGNEP
jgi:hypothetical protein